MSTNPEILNKIVKVDFPANQYFKQDFQKTQICLHHTVSGPGVMGDISYWKSTPDRIATCMIIDRNGTPYQCFSSKYWGYHLGVRNEDIISANISNYTRLDLTTIGVELDSWGPLLEHTDHKYYPVEFDKKKRKYIPNIKAKPVDDYIIYDAPYRNFNVFEKYTDEQIESLRQLLIYWGSYWKIPLRYNEDMFDLSYSALSGVPGIWSHSSYRLDKSDINPYPPLVQMLKSLN